MSVLDLQRTKADFLKKKGKSSEYTLRSYEYIFKHLEKFCLEKFHQFSVEKGNKGIQKELDYVLKYHGHKVTMKELAIMCAFMFWNEDSIYPRGILNKEQNRSLFQGGKMFQALINSSMDFGFPTKEILKANNLDKYLS